MSPLQVSHEEYSHCCERNSRRFSCFGTNGRISDFAERLERGFLCDERNHSGSDVVPLHAHADPEVFFHLTGSLQVWERDGGLEWLDVKPGDLIEVTGNAKHAFRNESSAPAIELITTTPKIGRFFQEVGKSLSESAVKAPPTSDELRHFTEVSQRYGYWNASPAENAAVGIILPGQ